MLEFFSNNQMYIVLGIILIVWAGIVIYLMRLDGRLKKLEKSITGE